MGKNRDELVAQAEEADGQLMTKIENAIERFSWDLTSDQVLEKIRTDRYFASFFIKDPRRQNISENCQLAYLRLLYPSLEKPNGLYLLEDGSSKSIDFWVPQTKENPKTIYMAAKHTTTTGGSQTNQFNDLKASMTNFEILIEQTPVEKRDLLEFRLICSGDYFTASKIRELLNHIGDDPRIKVVCLDHPLLGVPNRLAILQRVYDLNSSAKSYLIDASVLNRNEQKECLLSLAKKKYITIPNLYRSRSYRFGWGAGCVLLRGDFSIEENKKILEDLKVYSIQHFRKEKIYALHFSPKADGENEKIVTTYDSAEDPQPIEELVGLLDNISLVD
jgi:hypothetical protein